MIRPPSYAYRRVTASGSRRGVSELCCDAIPLRSLAEKYGTPLYVYSGTMIRSRLRAFDAAFRGAPHTLCYAMKANPALAVLRLVAREGHGFDVVSAGELERLLRVSPRSLRNVVFSGVGKARHEMEMALRSGILLFNVESASELEALAAEAARQGTMARVAIRVNPDLPSKTHPYISTGLHRHKFGVPIPDAEKLYASAAKHAGLQVAGVSVHIGSQISDARSFSAALERVAGLVRALRQKGHSIRYVDAGGGLSIPYEEEDALDFRRQLAGYAKAVTRPLKGLDVHLLLEPGRSIVGPAGVLLTRVLYRKTNNSKRFLIVDAAMNDLLRPALYGAHHDIAPVVRNWAPHETTDVVGPVCETGDFLARNRTLPVVQEDDLLAVLDTGAYSASQGSNYNTRGKPAEVLVEGRTARCIRRRESAADQMRLEAI